MVTITASNGLGGGTVYVREQAMVDSQIVGFVSWGETYPLCGATPDYYGIRVFDGCYWIAQSSPSCLGTCAELEKPFSRR